MRSIHLLPLAGAVLATGLCAQTTRKVVSPKGFDKVDGPTSSSFPFFRVSSIASSRIVRQLEVHDLGPTTVGRITGLAFRHDSRAKSTSKTTEKCVVDVSVDVSSAKTTSKAISRTWASNHGTDLTTLVARKKINFAAYPRTPVSPQPFFFRIPADAGKGLVFKGGSLAIEYKVYGNDLYNATTRTYRYNYLDRVWNSTSGQTTVSGRACYGSNRSSILPFYAYFYSSMLTSTNQLRFYGFSYNGVSGGLGVSLISLGALPRAIQLAGGCFLHVNPGLQIATVPGVGRLSNGSSSTTYYYPPYKAGSSTRQYVMIPWSSQLRGQKVYAQALGVDPGANSLGLTFTNLNALTLPTYDPNGTGASTVYNYNATALTSSAARFTNLHYGIVTEITY